MDELLMLDVRTLAFVSSVGGFLMAVTMLGIFLAGTRTRALIDWTLAGLAFGIGYLVGHLLQTIAVPFPAWIAGTLANALIGVGHGLVLIGVQRYLGQRPWVELVLVAVVLIFVTAMLFDAVRESLRLRIIAHSSFYILVDGYAGWLLWRSRERGMVRFHRAVAMVLFVFAAFLALRLGYALISPALTTSFVQDPFQALAFLNAMVFGFCLTMALAVMLFREKQLELMGLAQQDPLTGMKNRLSLDQVAERERLRALETGTPLTLLLMDIDHFKQINDEFGHQAGDKTLRAVSDVIEQVVRASDHAFRFGGEEFLIVLPGADAGQAEQVAGRLRAGLSQLSLEFDGRLLDVTASFGVVEWPVDEQSWDQCLKRADEALYEAKHAGRDQVIVAAPVPASP